MTSRMENFSAWTEARQSLGTGVAPLLPLSSCSVYKDRQRSASQAKRGACGPANTDLANMESLGKSQSSAMKSQRILLSLLQSHLSK